MHEASGAVCAGSNPAGAAREPACPAGLVFRAAGNRRLASRAAAGDHPTCIMGPAAAPGRRLPPTRGCPRRGCWSGVGLQCGQPGLDLRRVAHAVESLELCLQ